MSTPIIQPGNIPQNMRDRAQWVVGRYGKLNASGKRAKLPIDARNGAAASSTNPATWSTFDDAHKAMATGQYDFMGFMLSVDDPFTFIDLDNVIRNGELVPGAMATIKRFASYTERSISETGVHIIVDGAVPAGRKRGDIEVYSQARFVVMTGQIVAGLTTIHPRQTVLDEFYAESFPAQPQPHEPPRADGTALPTSDTDLLRIIQASKGSTKFDALWAGNLTGYSSHSEADLSLCAILAFWTAGDAERMDRLFRQSALYRPEKWDKNARAGETYGTGTIKRAIGQVTKSYSPSREQSDVARLVETNREIVASLKMRSATHRVALAVLTYAELNDRAILPISSRYISDKTGLSHRSAQMEMRLLCPETRQKRVVLVQKDTNRTQAQLQRVMVATTADHALAALPATIQKSIVAKRGNDDAAVMAECAIYLQNKITRLETELAFYAKNEAAGNTFDLLTCNSTSDGSALANVYTVLTLQVVSTDDINTSLCAGSEQQTVSIRHCGNNLQSSRTEQEFVESVMNDDAFVKAPPARLDPRLSAIDDKSKRARVAKLLAPDEKLKPFGLSAPRVMAYLDCHPNATVDEIISATGLGERTVRKIFKAMSASLVEKGYLPLVEASRVGRKFTYNLASDWQSRLDDLRSDLATNGLVAARTVRHAGERIQRIEKFLGKNQAAPRKALDEQTRQLYEQIRDRARQLQTRLSGGGEVDKTAALDISTALATVENVLIMPMPEPIDRVYFNFSDAWTDWGALKAKGLTVKLGKAGDGLAVRIAL